MTRARTFVLAVLTCAGLGVSASPAIAAEAPDLRQIFENQPGAPCPTYEGGDRICTAEVPSFDGTKLDVDVTLPRSEFRGEKRPLIILLHGFGGDKHDFESVNDEADLQDKFRWNNHWFARHGYYVINYTARGFDTPGPTGDQAPYAPTTPNGSSSLRETGSNNGTIQLKTREGEIRDTQYLAALAAKAFPNIDPNKVAVSGNSYGAGESWVQASQPDWTFPHEQDSSLPVLRLQAAIPKWGWTDLGYGLAPNGHPGGPSGQDLYESSTGQPRDPNGQGFPVGTEKFSYTNAFFAIGNRDGVFEIGNRTNAPRETALSGPINIPEWNRRITAQGDPYDVGGVEDTTVQQIRRGLTEFRSGYYQDKEFDAQNASDRRAGIFTMQGWTDDLFPVVEATRQFKDLKRRDPRWPVSIELADIGHPRAQNKLETWRRLNARAFQWLQSNITGPDREQTTIVSSEPTLCPNDGEPDRNDPAAQRLTATTPEGLANGALRVNYRRGDVLTYIGGTGDPDGPNTDAIVTAVDRTTPGACRMSETQQFPGRYTAVSEPLTQPRTLVGIPEVRVPYTLLGGNTATLNARLWDIAPNGNTTIVTRGTYRISVAPRPGFDTQSGVVRMALYGNHWPLRRGHSLRLDLAQVDEPTYRRSNVPTAIRFDGPTLEYPTREAGTETVGGDSREGEGGENTPDLPEGITLEKLLGGELPGGFPAPDEGTSNSGSLSGQLLGR